MWYNSNPVNPVLEGCALLVVAFITGLVVIFMWSFADSLARGS